MGLKVFSLSNLQTPECSPEDPTMNKDEVQDLVYSHKCLDFTRIFCKE